MSVSFHPGVIWLDTDGKPIQAHGGGILYENGIYYWYGENKDSENYLDESKGFLHRVDVIGISCYSSTDLLNWKNCKVTCIPRRCSNGPRCSAIQRRGSMCFSPTSTPRIINTRVSASR